MPFSFQGYSISKTRINSEWRCSPRLRQKILRPNQ